LPGSRPQATVDGPREAKRAVSVAFAPSAGGRVADGLTLSDGLDAVIDHCQHDSVAEEVWTLAQLPGQVAALLEGHYAGQRSGRVEELPSERSIRWYTTIGMVDRPVAHRGRTVLYGPRHVLQLAAIKMLQAQGHSLAEVQERLVGASDRQLAGLVGLPVADPAASAPAVPPAPAAFWKHSEGRPLAAPPAPMPAQAGLATRGGAGHGIDRTALTSATARPAVRLADTVTVVLDAATRVPDEGELAAIAAAAAPLLDLLERLGLTGAAH
jgi:DNA-binding transcriptional MerR regulator